MDEASQVGAAAREAVRDIAPEQFSETVMAIIDEGSMAPGVLAVLCARTDDETVAFDAVAERAAGTQLAYEGLRLTRALADDAPWEGDGNDGIADDGAANVEVLAADVLVARGFSLLARTEAAGTAVETVRNFGRDRTLAASDAPPDCRLEADIFELAAVAGTTVHGPPPSRDCRAFVADLARSVEGELPAAAVLFDAETREALRTHTDVSPNADAGARPSVTDP